METGVIAAARTVLHWWATVGQGHTDTSLPEAARAAAWQLLGLDSSRTGMPPPIQGPLESIFNRVAAKGAAQQPPPVYLRPAPLAMQREVLFPVAEGSAPPTSPNDLAALSAAVARIEGERLSAEIELEALFYALQRHGWALPSPLAAVSLFDFARTHAAVAAAQAAGGPGLFLLGGDLSGVQDFIYTLTAKGATKQLRGRSFYLQMLSEAIAHSILTTTGMPLTNLLYNGGGRFYVLLPGSAGALVDEIRRTISMRLLQRHGGTLYVALGGVPYDLQGDSRAAWDALTDEIAADKRRRFAALGEEAFTRILFTPRQPDLPSDVTDVDSLVPQDPLSRSLEELTPRLHNLPYLLLYPIRPRPLPRLDTLAVQPDYWYRVLQDFGLSMLPVKAIEQVSGSHRSSRLLTLLDRDDEEVQQAQAHLSTRGVVGMRYTTAVAPIATAADVRQYNELGLDTDDDQPLQVGAVKPFSLLVKQSEGIDRLGVLRMDVDDLGDLFGQRLQRPNGVAGLAVTAALSAALSRFFEGWVGHLCRETNKESAHGSVYAVYSGGDDLFIVGSWQLLPELAATIRNDLLRFTMGSDPQHPGAPLVTISAGITLHGAKYPLYQAADEAKEALEAAKSFTRPDGRTKDAFSFLGQTLGWEHYAEVHDTMTLLCQLVETQGVPRALLMTIQSLYARYHTGRVERLHRTGLDQFAHGPWVWQGAYLLTRLAERSAQGGAREAVAELRDRIVGDVEGRFIERAGLAARWAQLRLRGRKEHNDIS